MSVLLPTVAALRTISTTFDLLDKLQERLMFDEETARALNTDPMLAAGLQNAAAVAYGSARRIQSIVDMAAGGDPS